MKTHVQSGAKTIVPAFVAAALALASCGDKPKTNDIIVKKPAAVAKKGVQRMNGYSQARDVEWLDGTYNVAVERKADTSLPQATDEQGNRYYDNRISLTIRRPDGSVFFSRTFSKADFAKYVDEAHAGGALLGIVFDHAEGGSLRFAASVGSPDAMSDEYVPLVVVVSRGGEVTVSKDTQLDTASDADDTQDEDDGV